MKISLQVSETEIKGIELLAGESSVALFQDEKDLSQEMLATWLLLILKKQVNNGKTPT